MMGGQASAYSIACRIYAPRYRQFSASGVYARAQLSEEVQQANSEAAYGDVLAAFRHFITHHNDGRPFLLAGHSQGSGHLQRLIAEELDTNWGTLGDRFIAGYIIGGGYPETKVLATKHLNLCQSPTESGVIIGWGSISRVLRSLSFKAVSSNLCGGLVTDVNSKDAGPSPFADPTAPPIKSVGTNPCKCYCS